MPKVLSFTPNRGTTGAVVTITGLNLGNIISVSFGNTLATAVTLISPTNVSAVVGNGASGFINVINRNGMSALSQKAMFIYTLPVVADKAPVTPPVVEKKFPVIPDEGFKKIFQQFCEGKQDASVFNTYLCNGGDTEVLDNDSGWTTVSDFCKKMREKKKIIIGHTEYKISSVVANRNPSSKCVLSINIK